MQNKFSQIPEELKKRPQWVVWKAKPEGNKIKKIPYNPKTGQKAEVNNQKTWGSFQEAIKYAESHKSIAGIGYMLSKDDPYTFIDFDHCLNSDKIKKWAQWGVSKLNSYTEISPSGTGLHTLIKAQKPGSKSRKGNIEIYDSNRYFTITGEHIEGLPKTIEDRQKELNEIYYKFLEPNSQELPAPVKNESPLNLNDLELIEKAKSSKNGYKFKALWEGSASNFKSRSEADYLLCCHLAFWTGGDKSRIDRLFRQSQLYRKKWERADYRDKTIEKAMKQTTNFYGSDLKEKKQPKKEKESKKEKFNPIREAERYRRGKKFILLNEEIRTYKNGWYQPIDDRILLIEIAKQLQEDWQGRLTKSKETLETLKNILAKESQDLEKPESIFLNVKNGILNIDSLKLEEHTHKRYFTFQISANFNPNAKCPNWNRFLQEVLAEKDTLEPDYELIEVIQEFIGYCLLTKIPFHKALILYGGGNNGKSVFVHTIERLFNQISSHVHFEDIGVDTFATSDLANSLINISPEISYNAKLRDGQVKSIISGDKIRAQRKFQRAFDFQPIAKHFITANNLPRSSDKSFGFFRRFMIIPFWQTFLPESEIENPKESLCRIENPFLREKLEKEIDGIFLWALKGLRRLLEKKFFSRSKQIEELGKIFRIRSKSVEEFSEQKFDTSDVCQNISVQIAYKEYIKFCKSLNIPPISTRKFTSELRHIGFLIDRGTDNKVEIKGASLLIETENFDQF